MFDDGEKKNKKKKKGKERKGKEERKTALMRIWKELEEKWKKKR